ncbi:hypothetical protein LENED_006386 [Lentinula edodes]|uniref:Fungal-type protein kinase domain-containing protein n=1 Tax=Lentinula edodes TaxID=5353 RepID=A0A1Q3EBJ1_LENED|nr:hypothetical protein LENED_006386 [Lentinula edodes]
MELKKGAAEFHWNLLKYSTPLPEYRSLCIHVGKWTGTSLVSSPSPLVLFTAILHAMLGWLTICQEALQHRDILQILWAHYPYRKPCRLLCSGFIIDGDMAVDWKTYFDANHDGTRSGTPEFMSVTLRESLYLPMTYVQSTVDDLASFYYVGQWAAVFNPSHQSDMLEELRNRIAGSLASREFATRIVHRLDPDLSSHRQEYGLFLQCCQPILKEWYDSIDSLDRRFLRVTEELTAHSDGKIDPNTYRSLFLSFSYHGVADFAQILERHGASLASYDKMNS